MKAPLLYFVYFVAGLAVCVGGMSLGAHSGVGRKGGMSHAVVEGSVLLSLIFSCFFSQIFPISREKEAKIP